MAGISLGSNIACELSGILTRLKELATQAAQNLELLGCPLSFLSVGDFNTDGKLDIAGTNLIGGGVSVFIGNRNGTFGSGTTYGATAPNALETADVDGDGVLDLIAARSSSIYYLKGTGNGTFLAAQNIATGSVTGNTSLALGDFNSDGVLDVLTHVAGNSSRINFADTFLGSTIQRLNFTTRADALAALSTIDAAFSRVSRELGAIGAAQSRLLTALETISSTRENSLAAAGRIYDADVAFETAHLVREQIIQRAGAAVLSQANQAPALALQLLNTRVQ